MRDGFTKLFLQSDGSITYLQQTVAGLKNLSTRSWERLAFERKVASARRGRISGYRWREGPPFFTLIDD
jgi:hypothetical protein